MSIELPFLKAICWQTADIKQLTPAEMLSRYEQGWHYRGVLGQPSAEELVWIAEISHSYGSWLTTEIKTKYPQLKRLPSPEIIIEGLYLLAADFAVELAPNQQE